VKLCKKTLSFVGLSVLFLGACGGSSDQQDSGDDTMTKIVAAACSDLRDASTSAEAAQTLNYAAQLAESVGVSNTQLGSLLSSACGEAIDYARTLP
jgi:hypothetical protein